VLPSYHHELSAKAQKRLQRLGVEIRAGTRVTNVERTAVWLGDTRLPARTAIWAAGVAASPLARSLATPLDHAGRVLVRPDLSIPGHDDLFVIGDLAALEQDGKPVPGVSPAAIQEGRHTARNIRRRLRGEPARPFRYLDKGSFAVIGRGSAVGDLFGKVNLSGPLAWIAWLAIHLYFLIGFRNRLFVLIDWAYSYLIFRRGARLITGAAPMADVLAQPGAPPGRRTPTSARTAI
jgi:NADH dehydrogenase